MLFLLLEITFLTKYNIKSRLKKKTTFVFLKHFLLCDFFQGVQIQRITVLMMNVEKQSTLKSC